MESDARKTENENSSLTETNAHDDSESDEETINESEVFENYVEETLYKLQGLKISTPNGSPDETDSAEDTADTNVHRDTPLKLIESEVDENEQPPTSDIKSSLKREGCGNHQASTSHTRDFTTTSDTNLSEFNRYVSDEQIPNRLEAVMSVPEDAEEYNMDHKRRGYAVIFNHTVFDTPDYDFRNGSLIDVKKLQEKLRDLEFEVKIYHNLTYKKITSVLSKLAKEDHSEADCLVVVVMTHGEKGCLVARDSCIKYDVGVLWSPFTADKCTTLAGKPKLFFIQACRGGREYDGVLMRSSDVLEADNKNSSYTIPIYADFLMAYSTIKNYRAYRHAEQGSWFIQALCQELNQEDDLLQILTRTTRRVSLMQTPDGNKQIPTVTTMLTRNLYFRPKNEKP